jgi:hypothetical protein
LYCQSKGVYKVNLREVIGFSGFVPGQVEYIVDQFEQAATAGFDDLQRMLLMVPKKVVLLVEERFRKPWDAVRAGCTFHGSWLP